MSVRRSLRIVLLASEWKSSKGGLSTLNRELAIQLAKHPNVKVSFFVPECSDDDKRAASNHNVEILRAENWPGYEPVDWLAFLPKGLEIDFVIGHGVILGKQAQIIKYYHNCKWLQVVHTAPEKLAMHKAYSGAIAKGEEKQLTEIALCEKGDLVVAVGPELKEIYAAHLNYYGVDVFDLTPGIFPELYHLKGCFQWDNSAKSIFRVLLFGRSDSEDFFLKGFDIAAKAIANLNDESYFLSFVGAHEPDEIVKKFKSFGLSPDQLSVRSFLESREEIAKMLCSVSLAIVPSRTEGFGLTALEALSAGVPFLVSEKSGFAKAIQRIGPAFIVQSDDPVDWAEAIKGVRQKGSERAIRECQELRTRYAETYSWDKQCKDLVTRMQALVHSYATPDQSSSCSSPGTVPQQSETDNLGPVTKSLEATKPYDQQGARPKERFSPPEHCSSLSKTGNDLKEGKVIGGDDNYKDGDEEDREVISRWARRKVSSQFSEEFMDGRKRSFIFSWDKNHRKIHEEALLHFLDPSKRGKKFDYQPPKREPPLQSLQQLPPRGQEQSRKTPGKTQTQQQQGSRDSRQTDDFFKENKTDCRPRGAHSVQPVNEQKRSEQMITLHRPDIEDPLRSDDFFEEDKSDYGYAGASFDQQARGKNRPQKTIPQQPLGIDDPLRRGGSFEKTKADCGHPRKAERVVHKELSILGWSAKDQPMSAVKDFIQRHRNVLDLTDDPEVYNATIQDITLQLERNPVKYCVLVVDAEKMKATRDSEKAVDYLKLLQTAETNVEVKICIVVCFSQFLFREDEISVIQIIANAFADNRKVSVAWFVNGKLMPSEDQLLLLLTSNNADSSSSPEYQSVASQIQQGPCFGTSQDISTPPPYGTENPPSYPLSGFKVVLPPEKTVELFARLRFGKIWKEDDSYQNPGFAVPNYVLSDLEKKWAKTSDAELIIWLGEKGECVAEVNTGKKTKGWQQFVILKQDESVILQTRMKSGTISYNAKKGDVVYCYPNWTVPPLASHKLKQRYQEISNAELIGISSAEGYLRFVVLNGSYRDEWSPGTKMFEGMSNKNAGFGN